MAFREIIQIFVGQAGCQIGDACWELYAMEHNVDHNGDLKVQVQSEQDIFELSTFFTETPANKAAPRTILIDSEPSVLDEIRIGSYRNFFDSVNLISGVEDAASNFGRGYFHLSADLLKPTTNAMRKQVEQCDGLQGIIFHRAYGGGTGTGFACALLSAITEEYFKTPCVDLGIMPSLTMACGPVEPYNAMLSCQIPIEDVSLAMMMDNKALMNVCGKKLATFRPTFTNFNRIVAQSLSGLTASFRFNGLSNMNISDLRTNLVPYPEAHFALTAFAPFAIQESLDRWAPSTAHLTDEVFSPANQLISHSGEQPIYLSCCLFYRGKAGVRDVNASLERLRRSGDLPLVDWCPTGFKVGISAQPMSVVPASRIGQAATSVVALHNSTLFRDPLHNLVHAFNILFQRRAFLHWFLAEGLEEDEFRQALEGIKKLESDYTQFASGAQGNGKGNDGQGRGGDKGGQGTGRGNEAHGKSKGNEGQGKSKGNEEQGKPPVKKKASREAEGAKNTGNHRAEPSDSAYALRQKKMSSRLDGPIEMVDLRGAPGGIENSTYALRKRTMSELDGPNESVDLRAAPAEAATSAYDLRRQITSGMEGSYETLDLRSAPSRLTDGTYDRPNAQVSITLRVSHGKTTTHQQQQQQHHRNNKHRSTTTTSKQRTCGDETASSKHRSHKRSHATDCRDLASNKEKSKSRTGDSCRHYEATSCEARGRKRYAAECVVGEQQPEIIDLCGRELRHTETMEDLCAESFQDYLSDENCIERNNLHNDYELFRRHFSSDLYDTDNQTTGIYSKPGRPDFGTTRLDRALIDRMNSASPALKKGHHHAAAVDICQICEEEKCAYCDVEYDEFHKDDKNDDSWFRMHPRKCPCCRTQKSSSRKSHKPSRTPSLDPKTERAESIEGPLRAVLTGLDNLREVVTCLKRRL